MKSNDSGSIAMGLLHASGGRGRLVSSLGSKLFPGSLSSNGFENSLLNTSHLFSLPPCPLLVGKFPIVFSSSPSVATVLDRVILTVV